MKEALINNSFNGHLIFASSYKEDSDSLYGKAKKESRIFLSNQLVNLRQIHWSYYSKCFWFFL